MQIIIERRCIVAETNADAYVLRILYNASEIRNAYIIWSQVTEDDEIKPLPEGYDWLTDYQPTAFIILNNHTDIEMPGAGQLKAKEKIEKEIKELDDDNQKEIDNIFGFLK